MSFIAKTKDGALEGSISSDGSYMVYKGVPYATPPVGELRFRKPQPLKPWEGVLKAVEFKGKPFQTPQPEGSFYCKEFNDDPAYGAECNEDCLYLNIWTPTKKAKEKLPVAFWIHGGAFLGGYGHGKEFDGEAYCKRDTILVTINYRVGAFGFLAHPLLSDENEERISGNYGSYDQIMALTWVYENIAEFGGDPNNITIFGQSAGAMSVQTLVSSELTKNMIAKAILQSGGGYDNGLSRDLPLVEAEKIGKEFLELGRITTLEELRNLPAKELLDLQNQYMGQCMSKGLGLCFLPNIDGHLLKAGYYELIDRDEIKDIPYMLGSTKEDILTNPQDVAEGKKGSLYEGCIKWSLVREEHGKSPSYVYYFTRQLPGDDAGAFHSAELWYMFGTLNRSWRPKEEKDFDLSNKMLDCWTNFMRSGNPDNHGSYGWKPYTKEEPCIYIFE